MAVSHWNTGPSAVRYRLKKKNTNTARLQASERASELGMVGWWAQSSQAGEKLRKVSEQASLDVIPIILGRGRNFAMVGKQAEDR